ncbi:hypothetical protein CDAR_593941 [Caerostris darwini]|uniref:Uncharacterized protein n=1 Tax=Caerostris darwini TaxID=1538125 RepID=A0AAV4RJ75_9ARAC|nr:hypothetical protein CDAR_593941 [Caerostris darwini]
MESLFKDQGLTTSKVKYKFLKDGPNEVTPPKEPLRFYHISQHLRGITVPLMTAMLLCFATAAFPQLAAHGIAQT